MEDKEHLKKLIDNYQTRIKEYKELFGSIHKNKDIYLPDDLFTIEFKDFLRSCKNEEEHTLKGLVKELTYYNQGLNPPYVYSDEKQE